MYVDEEEYQQDVLKQRSEEETYYLDKIDMYKFDKKEKEDKIKNGTYQKGQLDHDDDDKKDKMMSDHYQKKRDELPNLVKRQKEKIRRRSREKKKGDR